jgi:RNA polymerase sigma-70 factor (ECF subfamily)
VNARSGSTDLLVERAVHGDSDAVERLFAKYRDQLKRMVAVRMDPRLAARLDPSDIVQETLTEASRMLADYFKNRPMPFYPWLRKLAWERLVDSHRQHVRAEKRSVRREQLVDIGLSAESVAFLAKGLLARESSPSARTIRQELLDRVAAAMEQLAASDREILILRHLEQLTVRESAEVLGISRSAAKVRHFRAVKRLHDLLGNTGGGASHG